MDYETIILDRTGHVATITLNRPQKLNAINPTMFSELKAALAEVNEDREVRVLVLTGAGRAFCSSFDVDEMSGPQGFTLKTVEEKRQFMRHYPQRMTLGLRNMEIPTIAMVNGLAIGVAVDWVLSCDIRVGSENTRFMNAFGRMALVPNTGATWLWPRVMGTAKALELLYTCDWVDGQEALRLGILNRLVAADELERETMALAGKIASGAPIVQRMLKTAVYRGQEMALESHLELLADYEAITDSSDDHAEAVAAWQEKRQAVFRGT